MNRKLMKEYLAHAEQIIGKRTLGEIAYDDVVVNALEQGYPIEAALAVGAAKHPKEALQWTPDTLSDIAEHYAYLREHAAIVKMLQQRET